MALIAIAQNRRMSDYVESVRRAGGEPIEVGADGEAPEHILARVDGILLTGGATSTPICTARPATPRSMRPSRAEMISRSR